MAHHHAVFVALLGLLTLAISPAFGDGTRSTIDGAPSPSVEGTVRPNIVVFITDDHSQPDSSVYGSQDLRTPNLQRLADAGMTFSHAFVASPSCAPSRAALLTGLMPARNGAEPNHSRPRADIKKFPAYFQELGYEVAAFGKVAHYNQAHLYGFDHSAAGKWLAEGNIEATIAFLRHWDGEEPLCLMVGTHEPHVPWPENSRYDADCLTLPPTHVDTPETRAYRARYLTAASDADKKLGTVYDLAQEVLGPETLFLFTSDHGAQWPFGKWNLYDEGIRVPLVIAWPGRIEAQVRTDAMVSWVDVLPTLVDLAGGSPPATLDGRSFADVLLGHRPQHREEIYSTHSGDGKFNVYPMRSVRSRDWKYIRNLHPEYEYFTHINRAKAADGRGYWKSWLAAARTDSHAAATVQRYRRRPGEELYDLRTDPYEQNNLAADPAHQDRLAAMGAQLQQWMHEQGDESTIYGEPQLLDQPPVQPEEKDAQ